MENENNVVTLVINDKTNLDRLAAELFEAKKSESMARQRVIAAENALLVAVPSKDEGSTTTTAKYFKVVTTGKVNRTLDPDETKRLYLDDEIPEAIYNRLFAWSPKLNLKELRYIEQNEPEFFAVIARRAMISKPGKTSVSVVELGPRS